MRGALRWAFNIQWPPDRRIKHCPPRHHPIILRSAFTLSTQSNRSLIQIQIHSPIRCHFCYVPVQPRTNSHSDPSLHGHGTDSCYRLIIAAFAPRHFSLRSLRWPCCLPNRAWIEFFPYFPTDRHNSASYLAHSPTAFGSPYLTPFGTSHDVVNTSVLHTWILVQAI